MELVAALMYVVIHPFFKNPKPRHFVIFRIVKLESNEKMFKFSRNEQ